MLPSDTLTAVAPVVAEFERLKVRYYLGGSLVSSTHGIPRSSLDVDMVADLAPKHVVPLVDALQATYYIDPRMIQDAISRRSCFNLIHLATSFKVDVFVLRNRPYDREALGRAGLTSLHAGNPSADVFVASPEDIVLAKLEWYRLGDEVSDRQWSDVLGVLKVQYDILDRSYMAKWAVELGVGDLLEKAWKEAEA